MVQDFVKYLKIVQKWWWVVALIFGATVGVMTTIALLSVPEYEAVAKVQVTAPPPQEGPLFTAFARQDLVEAIAQTQTSFTEFLVEGDVAWRVVELLPELNMTGREVRDKIIVEVSDGSQLMQVKVRAEDPEVAALLTNTLVEVGLDEYGVLLAQPTANTRSFIIQQLDIAQQELNAAEEDLTQFQIDYRVVNLPRAIDIQYDLIVRSKGEIDKIRAEGKEEQAQNLEFLLLEREAELQNLVGLSAEYATLVDRVTRARSNYTFLLDTLSEAQIKENQIVELGSIQLINRARIPVSPTSAISPQIIVLGAFASLFIGVLLAVLLEYLEVSRTPQGRGRETKQAEMAILTDQIS